MDIRYYYENTDLTLQEIANNLGVSYKVVWTHVAKHYSAAHRKQRKVANYRKSKLGDLNPMKNKTAAQHHNYIGIVGDSNGYLMMLKPAWYTGRKGSKHVFVHSVVMAQHLGITEIPAGHCVHHCDENPHNNDVGNLIMMTMGEHASLHHWVGATTISKESTAKWLEARRAGTPAMI